MKMMTNEGMQTPSVASAEPATPPFLYPIYVALFIAMGPGVDSASAVMSRNSSLVIQAFFSTNSFSSRASMA